MPKKIGPPAGAIKVKVGSLIRVVHGVNKSCRHFTGALKNKLHVAAGDTDLCPFRDFNGKAYPLVHLVHTDNGTVDNVFAVIMAFKLLAKLEKIKGLAEVLDTFAPNEILKQIKSRGMVYLKNDIAPCPSDGSKESDRFGTMRDANFVIEVAVHQYAGGCIAVYPLVAELVGFIGLEVVAGRSTDDINMKIRI
jgi:hypothetical protein